MSTARASVPAAVITVALAIAAIGFAAGRTAAPPGSAPIRLVDAASATPAPAQPTQGGVRTITVTGSGSIDGVPDVATVDFTIQTQAAHVTDALAQANRLMAGLTDLLTRDGVAKTDIQTSQLWISPNYGPSGATDGYQVSEGVSVMLRDLKTAGHIIDDAAQSGGDSVRMGGIWLTFADSGSLMAAARTKAVQDARSVAGQYAAAAGVTLGAVRTISDQSSPISYPMFDAARGAAAPASVPIQPGKQSVQVQVTVVYEIA